MIDTDKYEGHTPERWTVDEDDPFRVVDVQECTIARTDFLDIEQERAWHLANAQLIADAPVLLEAYKRLREENKKQNNVLTTLDEMIQRGEEHVELMKALEQGLGIPETWKEMMMND